MLNIMRQRSKLTFSLSAKLNVAHWSPINIFKVFSETTWPIELKFHMKTPYDRLAKIYTNCSGHVTKVAAMPI